MSYHMFSNLENILQPHKIKIHPPTTEIIMERVPSVHRSSFTRDSLSRWKAASNGVIPKTNAERGKYWDH